MSVLGYSEIEQQLRNGRLIKNPRSIGGQFDIQPASYDLMAGRAVWKDAKSKNLVEVWLDPALPVGQRPTVCIQPGQMLSVITHEELSVPNTMCATVFSKNSLAMNGIFAFNAGHVDPGYEGPIIIRMINLRSTPYTLAMGEKVYSVVFHHLAENDGAKWPGRAAMSQEEALSRVRQFAGSALSNALFDLYSGTIETILNESRQTTLEAIRSEMDRTYVKTAALEPQLRWAALTVGVAVFFGILAIVGLIVTALRFGPELLKAYLP